MLVFGTQIHIVTFIFIVLETGMFFFQLAYYSIKPQDKNRILYLILLSLMLFYNIAGCLFPDPKINLSISVQEMVAYGSRFLMASYFPFYFYKALDLKSLRWHALFGVPLFLILPYLIFFVIVYTVNGDLEVDIKYGMIAPFIYALILLRVIFKAIWKKHAEHENKDKYLEELAMYCAISPWASLAMFGMVEVSQLIEVLCTNTGIIAMSFLFIWKSIKAERLEYQQLINGSLKIVNTDDLACRFRKYKLTKREVEIVLLFREGLTYNEIAEKLFISVKTVGNHVQNIYDKTGVNNKVALIHKLFI